MLKQHLKSHFQEHNIPLYIYIYRVHFIGQKHLMNERCQVREVLLTCPFMILGIRLLPHD